MFGGACCIYSRRGVLECCNPSSEVQIMKLVIRIIIFAVAAVPALALAGQPSTGMTRAQVRAQLVQMEQAGYNPARRDNYYPRSIQQAEARIKSSESPTRADTSGYGATRQTGSASGSPIQGRAVALGLYEHH
jgi:hypothetical protein